MKSTNKKTSSNALSRSKKISIWKFYGVDRPSKPKYSGLAGVLWQVVSQYVRKSEFIEHGGQCVDGCGRMIASWKEGDCGHFMSSKHMNTRFMRENLGLQRKDCNNPIWNPDSSYGYGKTVDLRYGPGTANRLQELSRQNGKEMKKAEYDIEIRRYQQLLSELPMDVL